MPPAADQANPRQRLFELNAALGTAIVALTLGTALVVTAASALGQAPSRPARPCLRLVVVLALLFVPLVVAGQVLADRPGSAPYLFPVVNVLITAIPSLVIALLVVHWYRRVHPFAWPMSVREAGTAFMYGAIGATTVGGILNTLYLVFGGALLIAWQGSGTPWDLDRGLRTLPGGWGIAFDVSVLSVVAPLNEESWKGLIVVFFFFRGGGLARCFAWGVLAGAGFNLLETFLNSLGAVSPEAMADQQIGASWWFFAVARAGTATMHALAAGLAALGCYGLVRRRPAFLVGYPAGVLLHGTWNFLVYTVWGDAMLSRAWPHSTALDVAGGVGLVLVFVLSVAMLWALTRLLRDEQPAMIYRMIGMRPVSPGASRQAPPGAGLPAHSPAVHPGRR